MYDSDLYTMNEIYEALGLTTSTSIEDPDIDILIFNLKRLVHENNLDHQKTVLRDYLMNCYKRTRAYAKPIDHKYQAVRTMQFTVYNNSFAYNLFYTNYRVPYSVLDVRTLVLLLAISI